MVAEKSHTMNMQGEADTYVKRKFEELKSEKQLLHGKIEALNDHLKGWE